MRKALPEDICRWPDGTWCYRENLGEYDWMSDDYEVIPVEHPEWGLIPAGQQPVQA